MKNIQNSITIRLFHPETEISVVTYNTVFKKVRDPVLNSLDSIENITGHFYTHLKGKISYTKKFSE